MSRDKFPGTSLEYCPHDCPNCGGPCYIPGGEREAQCIEKECVFYNEDTWVGWLMRLDDTGDPPIGCTEKDFFDDEPTHPGITFAGIPITPIAGTTLDTYGNLVGKTRLPDETDEEYRERLLGIWS